MNASAARLPHLLLDLGDVLVTVDVPRALAHLARLTGLPEARVEAALFGSGLKRAFDLGQIGPRAFWDGFAELSGSRPPFLAFAAAYTDMFEPIPEVQKAVRSLRELGHATFLLSNTDPLHLGYCRARWPLVATMDATIASFDIQVLKPDPRFFDLALARLGLDPAECLFVDDRADNVAAAAGRGIAVHHAEDGAGTASRLLALGGGLPC
jgi:putative hydrolase of the HAD superfamily